ncbi:pyridine nucleotide-disulfide oxidoreductase [Apiospora kogelbergensis]|uniref:pyridine nucleotide-disulfide oxidoreductase n=1 Tax=Apiospora kogelbergensis TaxID=1337665 RepID=UPI00313057DB
MTSAMEPICDVLIVGGGPAGLAAALALYRQNHNSILFDSGNYRNRFASEMHMVSTWDHRPPGEFLAASRAELNQRYPDQWKFVEGEVASIKRVSSPGAPSIFEVSDAAGSKWRGRKVILATGVRDLLPFIDGIEDCWGHGVVHCLLCHGHEERGAESVAVLALDGFAEPSGILRVVRSCKQFANRVRIYTNGNKRVATQLRPVAASVAGCDVEAGEIDRLEMVKHIDNGGLKQERIHIVLEGSSEEGGPVKEHTHSFAMYHAGTEQASSLVEELGIQLDDAGEIKLGAFAETSQPGIFAAGDCASRHKYVTVASGAGFRAGDGAAQQLQAEGAEIGAS